MVDVTYADADGIPRGIAQDGAFQVDLGGEWNSWQLETQAGSPIAGGWSVGIRSTEYGGLVDWEEHPAKGGYKVVGGRSWRGVLDSKRILPPSGQLNFTVSGDANAALGAIVENVGLSGLFRQNPADCGRAVSWTFDRYVDEGAAAMAQEMLSSFGLRLDLSWDGEAVTASAVPAAELLLDADIHPMNILQRHRTYNHLVCAGSGEGLAREVVHWYADAAGGLSRVQSLFGSDEIVAVYDINNLSGSELVKAGRDKLAEIREPSVAELTDAEGFGDIASEGDSLRAVNRAAGVETVTPVERKTIKVDAGGRLTVRYE